MLVFVVAEGYFMRWLRRNEAIAAYLRYHCAELLEELITTMEAVTSDARQLERE